MTVVIDPQAAGWRDDWFESGLIRTEAARGSYVQVPFRRGAYTLVNTGSSSTSFNSIEVDNFDGSQTGMLIQAPSSATYGNFTTLGFWISGNLFGIRMRQTANPVGCTIDGQAFAVPTAAPVHPITGVSSTIPSFVESILIASDLGAGKHYVELTFPCAATGSTRSWDVYGYLADSQAGYSALPRGLKMQTAPTALTTSFAQLVISDSTLGMRKVFFHNTTAGALYIEARYVAATVFLHKIVAANDTYELDFAGILPAADQIYFKAEAGAAINATVLGAV